MNKSKELLWSNTYEVGNFDIDSEHKIFVNIINKISNAYTLNLDESYIESLIDELLKYAQFHFCNEENLMKFVGYPELLRHEKEHIKLLNKFRDMICSINYDHINFNDLIHFLYDWFIEHTTKEDKKLAKFIANKKQQDSLVD